MEPKQALEWQKQVNKAALAVFAAWRVSWFATGLFAATTLLLAGAPQEAMMAGLVAIWAAAFGAVGAIVVATAAFFVAIWHVLRAFWRRS